MLIINCFRASMIRYIVECPEIEMVHFTVRNGYSERVVKICQILDHSVFSADCRNILMQQYPPWRPVINLTRYIWSAKAIYFFLENNSGPVVWFQKFEYAIAHWLQKATEHVLGCVLCSPGCFSMFRGSALMDDNIMRKYTILPTEAAHHLMYDQGMLYVDFNMPPDEFHEQSRMLRSFLLI